jgi:hypothetical protein
VCRLHSRNSTTTRNPTKSRDFTTKLARNRLFAHQNTIKLASNSKICIWTSTTHFRGSFQHFDTKNGKITSDSGLDRLEPPTYDFDPFFRDDQNFIYEKSPIPEFEPATTESATKSFATPKSRQRNSSPTTYKINQTYAKITQS